MLNTIFSKQLICQWFTEENSHYWLAAEFFPWDFFPKDFYILKLVSLSNSIRRSILLDRFSFILLVRVDFYRLTINWQSVYEMLFWVMKNFLDIWLTNFNKASRYFGLYSSQRPTRPVMLINLLWSYLICLLGWYKVLSFQNYVLKKINGRMASIHLLDDYPVWKQTLRP